MPDAELTLADFAPHVGATFHVEGAADATEAELIEATASPFGGPAGARLPFTLVFRGPPGRVLPQQIYRVHHPERGALDIFLVPIAADADGVRYEAVFN